MSIQPSVVFVAPAAVPIAYQYLTIPLSPSMLASQLADSSVWEVDQAVSSPAPSLTWATAMGGVPSAPASAPLEFETADCRPAPFSDFTVK